MPQWPDGSAGSLAFHVDQQPRNSLYFVLLANTTGPSSRQLVLLSISNSQLTHTQTAKQMHGTNHTHRQTDRMTACKRQTDRQTDRQRMEPGSCVETLKHLVRLQLKGQCMQDAGVLLARGTLSCLQPKATMITPSSVSTKKENAWNPSN